MAQQPEEQTYDATTPETSNQRADVVITITILWHPNPDRVGDRATLPELSTGRIAKLSRETPIFSTPAASSAAPLEDACISRTPLFIAATKDGGIRIDCGESRTVLTHRGQAIRGRFELSSAMVDRGVVLTLGGRLVLLLHRLSLADIPEGETMGLVGESAAMLRVRREIRRLAAMDSPLLIRGETGTGKDLAARAIHAESIRRAGPFVAINLAAIPPTLASAELFGAQRGSFTGADKERLGYFQAAEGGTLFLDEIGDAPADVQVMLLRTIESGEIQGVGAGKMRQSNVRILAATDADLEQKVEDGSFRAPLLYRLSTYELRMPPLRERRDDIGRLLVYFLRQELTKLGALGRLTQPSSEGKSWLPAAIIARLADLNWPGNVRQLHNVIRLIVLNAHDRDRVELIPAVERLIGEAKDDEPQTMTQPVATSRRKPAEITEMELATALRASRWDLAATAQALGIPRASVYVLIERSGKFKTAADLSAQEITACHFECGGDLERMSERLEVSEKALRRRLRELNLGHSSKFSAR